MTKGQRCHTETLVEYISIVKIGKNNYLNCQWNRDVHFNDHYIYHLLGSGLKDGKLIIRNTKKSKLHLKSWAGYLLVYFHKCHLLSFLILYIQLNLLSFWASFLVCRLSVLILEDSMSGLQACVLFCFNPASIFYSSV